MTKLSKINDQLMGLSLTELNQVLDMVYDVKTLILKFLIINLSFLIKTNHLHYYNITMTNNVKWFFIHQSHKRIVRLQLSHLVSYSVQSRKSLSHHHELRTHTHLQSPLKKKF